MEYISEVSIKGVKLFFYGPGPDLEEHAVNPGPDDKVSYNSQKDKDNDRKFPVVKSGYAGFGSNAP